MFELENISWIWLSVMILFIVVLFLFDYNWKSKTQKLYFSNKNLNKLSPNRSSIKPIAKFIVGEKDMNNAEKSSKDFNVIGLIISRPVPGFAELLTLAAGITRMNFLKFITVVCLTNIGVAIVFAGLGAAALESSSSTFAFFGAAILPALFYFIYKKFYKI